MRDYDANPIIIKDYNYIFLCLHYVIGGIASIIIIVMMAVFLFPNGDHSVSITASFSILGLIVFYAGLFRRIHNKRTIMLANNKILFLHNNEVVESINLSEITEIKKTFSPLYNKTQVLGFLCEKFTFFIFFATFHVVSTTNNNKISYSFFQRRIRKLSSV